MRRHVVRGRGRGPAVRRRVLRGRGHDVVNVVGVALRRGSKRALWVRGGHARWQGQRATGRLDVVPAGGAAGRVPQGTGGVGGGRAPPGHGPLTVRVLRALACAGLVLDARREAAPSESSLPRRASRGGPRRSRESSLPRRASRDAMLRKSALTPPGVRRETGRRRIRAAPTSDSCL